ncbi:MAG: putative lipid II flippase FtsW [Firmicutes bacterium]|nr:putative lipid II flippase FtsW [Bacillota bacterium]
MKNSDRKKFKISDTFRGSRSGDLVMVLIVLALCLFGIIMVFSASYYDSISETGTPYAYLIRQSVWFGVGLAAMLLFSRIDYHLWGKIWILAYVVGLVLLVAVLIPGIGINFNNATRWIAIGPITIMPGEIAKICLIFYVAGLYARSPELPRQFTGMMAIIVLTGVYAALILKQPNMSTAFTIIFICGGMLLVGGAKIYQLLMLAGVGAAAGFALIVTSEYRRLRLLSFLDPFEDPLGRGYQVVQSLLALGTGGFKGLGLGNSVQKYLYLPESQNDFILAIIGEELGFVGIVVLLIVYLVLIWRGCRAAMRAKDLYGMMMASGITIMIGVQVAINVAVVTSSMPPTGVILPFVSYGGNALLLLMGLMGIMWNITRQSQQAEDEIAAERLRLKDEESKKMVKRNVAVQPGKSFR